MQRYDIINWLIEKYGYRRYLEIGTAKRECFDKIACEYMAGTDPEQYFDVIRHNNLWIWNLTSDKMFETYGGRSSFMFDIIFIDGDHHEAQVIKDIHNSLKHLSEGGTIVVHDCNPPLANCATKEPRVFVRYGDTPEYSLWNGTTWQAYVHTRLFNREVTSRCVDADWGCGIIQRGPWIPWDGELGDEATFRQRFNYDVFAERRGEYLNLITPKQFKEIYHGR